MSSKEKVSPPPFTIFTPQQLKARREEIKRVKDLRKRLKESKERYLAKQRLKAAAAKQLKEQEDKKRHMEWLNKKIDDATKKKLLEKERREEQAVYDARSCQAARERMEREDYQKESLAGIRAFIKAERKKWR
ncbi:hypothetical protein CAEBREN_07822 [Caenorhabditis brenneri]|uniref:Uncharacterized protein n=1 Tax=Caenorhabditis brenneri TaxID=135651 RepID=G0MYE4_CAEBE|nr:hypothetical protein CAEBREN_07822 [Caenorhabditis brenneri]